VAPNLKLLGKFIKIIIYLYCPILASKMRRVWTQKRQKRINEARHFNNEAVKKY